MLKWAAIFLVIALVAGLFGFTGIASAAAGIAKFLSPLPRRMPDLLCRWHIGREKSPVTGRDRQGAFCGNAVKLWKLLFLPRLPRLQHVFLAELALVAHEGELQTAVGASELVGGWPFARFRGFSARLLNRNRIARHRIFAPDIDLARFIKSNLEGTVGFDRPNRAERVCPRAN